MIINQNSKSSFICSPKYLDEEFNYEEYSFLNLLYPKPFIQFAESKSFKIYKRKRFQTSINTSSHIIKFFRKHILDSNSSIKLIENDLNNLGIKTLFIF